jgi:hypothetical protein
VTAEIPALIAASPRHVSHRELRFARPYDPRVRVALGFATCLVGTVLLGCASVSAPSELKVLRPEAGQIVFGQEVVDNGAAVTERRPASILSLPSHSSASSRNPFPAGLTSKFPAMGALPA